MRTQLRSDTPLLEFWEATRLSADDARYPEQAEPAAGTDEAIRAALAGVLGRGCGQRVGTVLAKGGTFVQARTTPSAGALYPFEVLVGLSDGERCVSYLYEVDSGQLNPLASAPPVALAELVAQAGLADAAAAPVRAVVTLVARPWTSMAKYGRRGYLYTYLDIGHAATNLALAARAAGLDATVHLRFRRQWLTHALGLAGTCREPQAVVTITVPGRPPADRPAAGAPAGEDGVVTPVWRDRRQARLEPPGDPERRNFEALRDISLSYAPAAVARPGRIASVTEPPSPAEPSADVTLRRPRGGPDDHTALAARRQSAKGFLPAAVSLDQVAGLLDGLDGRLAADFAESAPAGIGVRLVARAVTGLAPGAYAWSARRHALHPAGGGPVGEEDVLATCQRQDGLRHAGALVLLHTPLRALLREQGRAGLAEVHFHAAHVAQRMCVNAARERVGITCVGGFDEAHAARLGHLPRGEEVIYLLAVGVADPAARKVDRDPVAYSHGRTAAGLI
ncbi:nitroreductase family protein [Micromonospora chaiyaphumensis]|uniref:SagB-type dehydrogenase domain-containing protein n=1 Tax=Micromonospora chaiyaphumensis TaxID=307119 RepID=A0A1C4VZV3_9ACTN|nr:nitroreductase family protein [Micromonospora chaiyaphumensis]SCE89395.1 SagB-type dehydrogenase domain-containing protein [Micromonospora chaiyaphumensis]